MIVTFIIREGGRSSVDIGGLWGFHHSGAMLERSLDALGMRHRVTAHNVANVNTPGYKPYEVTFEAALGKALRQAEADRSVRGVSPFPIRITEQSRGRMRADGNGVDIDKEMVVLAKTSIAYNALSQQWSGLYGRVRMAVREGRR